MVFNWIWFLNGASLAATAVISFYGFLVWYTNRHISIIGKILGVSGLMFLVYSFLNIVWGVGIITPIESDFILIGGLFNIITALFFVIIVYNLTSDKNLLYVLFLFLLTAFAMPLNTYLFFSAVSFVSYAIIAIASFDLFLPSSKLLRKAGSFSLFYSLISIFLLITASRNISKAWWFIPNIILFTMFLFLVLDIENWGQKQKKESKQRKRKILYPLLFIKFVIFISFVTIFALLSTIVLHEMGHALAGQYYGCERSRAVIYDISDLPHTEMICRGYYNDTIITLTGIFLPIIIGLIFLLTGSGFTTNLSCLIFGFSLIIPSLDLESLNVSQSSIFIVILSGFVILIYGIVRLSASYVRQKGGLFEDRKISKAFDEPKKQFWLDQDTRIEGFYGFLKELNKMGNIQFKNLIENRREEILNWIKNILEEENLAEELKNINNKKQMQVIIMNYLSKKESE